MENVEKLERRKRRYLRSLETKPEFKAKYLKRLRMVERQLKSLQK
jgi:hypothetical protein